MNEKDLINQLKALSNTPEGGMTDTQTKERIFKVLTARIAPTPIRSLGHIGLISLMRSFAPPRFVYALSIFVFLTASGAVAMASRNALPGDTLYGAKLAVEKTQVRFTSNPASRAKIQMELAGNRLKEVRMIKQEGGVPNGRMDDALTRFAKDVNEATDVLKQAADPAQVKAAASEIVQKAAQYKEELADLGQEETQSVETTSTVIEKGENPSTTQSPEDSVAPLPKKRTRIVGMAAIEQAEQALQNTQESLVNKNEDNVDNKDNN